MDWFTRARLYWHVFRWRFTWEKRDTHFRYEAANNAKFMSARDAVQLIRDGDVIATSGLAGNQRVSIMYWAIREIFTETGHPRNLTMMCTGGQGSRGKVPGSMEELGLEGLCTRLITAHQETFKSLLRLAAKGELEIQCLPQGIVAFLMEAQGSGEDSVYSTTGVGAFMDPRVGPGSHVFDPNAEQLITVEGDGLRFRAPKINVAMFGAPAADREGNVYLDRASLIAETLPGVFFGAAACPTRMVSSAEAFRLCHEKLDVAMLGALEADSEGNVNVSKRGEGPINYVGPGGFIDITTGARVIVFVATWMAFSEIEVSGGKLRIVKPGPPKFVDKVSEITFSGQEALKAGKKVFYVTAVGVFQLTDAGMRLILVMPGIDIQNDILSVTPMRIVLPESGQVPVAGSEIVTGQGFKLALRG